MALGSQGPARGLALLVLPALAVLLLAGVRPAGAQITTLEEAPTVVESEEPLPFAMIGLVGIGCFNTYDMLKVNEAIELLNRDISQPGVKFEQFSKGGSFGGGVRVILKERLMLDATWERVYASQDIGGTTAKSSIAMPADAYLFTVGWDLMTKRRAAFGPAVGVGWYDAKGEQVITETPVGQDEITVGTLEMTGTALGVHGGAYFESALAGHVWVNAFAGYRGAKVDDLEIGGFEELVAALNERRLPQTLAIGIPLAGCEECEDADENGIPDSVAEGFDAALRGGGRSLNWSGFMGRLALTWYFNAPVF
jgi:hypothetical protein